MFRYELNIEKFSGPIEKLLELIEEKKLEITELSMAEVTADFLNYIQNQTSLSNNEQESDNNEKYLISPRVLADFVAIAAKLLLIKSKALLPNIQLTEDEESDIKDLERRLKIHQQFKPAINYIKEISEKNKISISQPLFSRRPTIFYPSENLKIKELQKAIEGIFENIKQFKDEAKTIKSPLITLEEKIQEIINRISAEPFVFEELIKEKPRSEIVVLFLALLHLLGKQSIKVEQKEKFSDIIIIK